MSEHPIISRNGFVVAFGFLKCSRVYLSTAGDIMGQAFEITKCNILTDYQLKERTEDIRKMEKVQHVDDSLEEIIHKSKAIGLKKSQDSSDS